MHNSACGVPREADGVQGAHTLLRGLLSHGNPGQSAAAAVVGCKSRG